MNSKVEAGAAPAPRGGAGELYRALWELSRGHRGAWLGAIALLLGSQGVKLGMPWLASRAIDTLQLRGLPGLSQAGTWLALLFGATVLSWLLHGPGRVLERNVALVVRERLSGRLVERLLALPLAWHEGHHSGATAHRVQQSTRAVYDFAQSQFIYMQNAVRLVGPLVALSLLDPWVGFAAALGLAVISVSILGFDRAMVRLAHAENEAERRYTATLVDAMGNIGGVAALRQARGVATRVQAALAAVFGPVRRAIVVNEAKWCAVDVFAQGLSCCVLALYAWRAAQGLHGAPVEAMVQPSPTLALGKLYMVWEYALQAGGVLSAVASQFQTYARQRADYASADAILDAAPSHLAASSADAGGREAGAEVGEDWRQIAVQGLEFRHAHTPAGLHGVALQLERGRRYALVGGSGAGKSTLLRVLAGLHLPQQARWDFRSAQAACALDAPAGARWLARQVTLIPQEAEVFEGSLADNLALCETVQGPPAPGRFAPALETACATDFLDPQALDVRVAERGSNWSGGQRQRVALARGVLAAEGSSLVLLDEPTAALDPRTEHEVLARMFGAFGEACVVASVHRMNLLPLFDGVIVMQDGRVTDCGPVAEVARSSPVLQALLAARQGSGAGA